MKSAFFEKLLTRLDKLDPGSLQTQFLRLAQERGLMETIFQAIQEGIILLQGDGTISYANRTAERLLGFSLETAEGEPLQKYIRSIEWERLDEFDVGEWSRLVRREIEISYPEHRFLQFYLVPLTAVNPRETGLVLILRDVTREREREASTLESEKLNAIMLLAAGVAHEIGNPLNSLNIHLQLMDREVDALRADLPTEPGEPDKTAELTELLRVARDEITRLDQIIKQFLGALRPTEARLEDTDLIALIEQTLAIMHREINDRGILVELDAPEDLPRVPVDPGQIKQAFYNIINNAIQAMDDSGILKIQLRENRRTIDIAVTDTGKGISPEDLGHIFEPYHTRREGGNGLGLMIVQRILRDHGGHIEIDTQPGSGTTVTLVLPREDVRIRLLPQATGADAEPSPPSPSSNPEPADVQLPS